MASRLNSHTTTHKRLPLGSRDCTLEHCVRAIEPRSFSLGHPKLPSAAECGHVTRILANRDESRSDCGTLGSCPWRRRGSGQRAEASQPLHQGGAGLPLLLRVSTLPAGPSQNQEPQSTVSPCGPGPAPPQPYLFCSWGLLSERLTHPAWLQAHLLQVLLQHHGAVRSSCSLFSDSRGLLFLSSTLVREQGPPYSLAPPAQTLQRVWTHLTLMGMGSVLPYFLCSNIDMCI